MKNAEPSADEMRAKIWAAKPLSQPILNIKQEVISSFELASALLTSKNHSGVSMIAAKFKYGK